MDNMDSTNRDTNSTENSSERMNLLNPEPEIGSMEEGKRLLGDLLAPIPVTQFMTTYWKEKPISVNENSSDFVKNFISLDAISKMLKENFVDYAKNIEVTFHDENRTLAHSGRVNNHSSFWKYYNEECGVRVSNLEEFMPPIHEMNATLQEFFQRRITSNVYLTSKTGGGYKADSGDTDKFIIQVEGKNNWRVYVDSTDELVNYIDLAAGGLLYIPHGFRVETISTEDQSLHLTLTLDRIPTYGDLIKVIISTALDEAIKDNEILRKGISTDLWNNLGTAFVNYNNPQREPAINEVIKSLDSFSTYANDEAYIDYAVDQMASIYQCTALPPKLSENEKICSVYGTEVAFDENGGPKCVTITWDSKIRLIRENVVRLVEQDQEFRLYYSSQNTKDVNDSTIDLKQNYIKVSNFESWAAEIIIKKYPLFVTPRDLHAEIRQFYPCPEKDCITLLLAQELWTRSIVITDKSLV